jgi:hypothetical protein
MPDFSNSDERKLWLASQSDEIAVVLAARAALRIVPTIRLAFGANRSRMSNRRIILRQFRAIAAAWATATFPSYRDNLSKAAQAALRGLADLKAPLAERAIVYAAAAAAGEATDSDPRDTAATAIGYALDAAGSNGRVAFERTLAAISADVDVLEQRFDPVTLANSQLWPGRLPGWVNDDLLPNLPSIIRRVCSSFAPAWGVLRTRLV